MFGRVRVLSVAAALLLAACSSSGGVSETTSAPAETPDGTTDDTTAPADTGTDGNDGTDGDDDPDGGDGDNGGTGGDGDGGTGGDVDPAAFDPAPITWEPHNDAVDVGTLEVPVDYGQPDGPRLELFVARYHAIDQDDKIGSLLINPGGPGFGGADYATFAAQIFDRELLERFDIIGWDPRGTGESDPAIDCIDDYDPYFTAVDTTPEDAAERAEVTDIAEDFARQCIGRNREIIQHVGTNNAARDMDAIRRSLGEDEISYFGFSYGSELGATWATLFPDTVRAAVLDGASDPGADALESSKQQLAGFSASLDTFLARCADDPECEFEHGGEPRAALEELLAELDDDPAPTEDGRPPANRDVATTAIVQAMYSEQFWPALERSLAAAQQGDGDGLLALHDAYYQRSSDGTYGNQLEAFQAISCADTPERPSLDEIEDDAEELTEVAPLLSPENSVAYFCTFFPEALDPRVEITGEGAGPIVVIGTTGDPATPFESTVAMAEALEDGRLVVVEADQHTGYGVNECIVEVVNDYLIDLDAPPSGTECR